MEKKTIKFGIFLVHSLNNCGIGGMETHQKAFISNYTLNSKSNIVKFSYIIENKGHVYVFHNFVTNTEHKIKVFTDLQDLIHYLKIYISFSYIFLNDGWWIESVSSFKKAFPLCHIYMRSGGNDAELAPWNDGTYSYAQRRLLWKESIKQLDCIIANSDFSVSRLISMGINQHNIIKVRGGTNEVICRECRANKESLRNKLIYQLAIHQKYILIFAARFVPFKGIIPALECLKKSNNRDNCHILLVGSGELLHNIKEWCFTNLNKEQFTFIGESSNDKTIRLIAASDILINTSINIKRKSGDGEYIHTETMGRSMMEAISVRTKIIATDVGGTNELFSENQHIGYLSSLDEQSIITAFNMIETIINQRTTYACDYSWDRVFYTYDNMFSIHE